MGTRYLREPGIQCGERRAEGFRTGMPKDQPEDYDLDIWVGALPVSVTFGEPVPDPLLREEIPLPVHVRDRPG